MGGKKERGRMNAAGTQLLQQFEARHFRHGNIENKTIKLIGDGCL